MQLRRGQRTCEVNPQAWVAPHRVVEARPPPPIVVRRGRQPSTAHPGTGFSTGSRRSLAGGPRAFQSRCMHPSRRLVPLAAALALIASPATARTLAVGADPAVGRWPLRPTPEVVEGFDSPTTPWGPGHRGVDLAGVPGQEVRSALPGTVSFTGTIAGRGVVVVDHGDTRTTYEPVAASLGHGERVRGGDVLGVLTLPGSHCFPRACLHWGWVRGDTYLDPLRLVGAAPVRLLPLAGLPVMLPPITTPYADWRPLLRLLRPGVQP